MSQPETVIVITKDLLFRSIIERLLGEKRQLFFFREFAGAIDVIYNTQPHLIIIDLQADDAALVRMLNDLKSDPVFGRTPAIVVVPDTYDLPPWTDLLADDYLRRSQFEADLRKRVELSLFREQRIVEINPLTRLPGNITITKEIQRRLDAAELFAVAYADIDNFKPFNDKYGFSRGDEVLKMVGRVILNIVKEVQPHGSFVGHVGGDDFVFITEPDNVETAATRINDYFDQLVPTFYDPEDRAIGEIVSVDREGKERRFPLMTNSIGIAHTRNRTFAHYSEITQIAAEMKHFSKSTPGSVYKIDRRMK